MIACPSKQRELFCNAINNCNYAAGCFALFFICNRRVEIRRHVAESARVKGAITKRIQASNPQQWKYRVTQKDVYP